MTFTIKIGVDESASDPRKNDNLGTMVIFHKRYTLGDKTELKSENFSCFADLNAYLKVRYDAISLPIYMYDHSGITISTTPFQCRFDSGQIGYIYVSAENVRKEYGVKRISKKLREQVLKVLVSEVAEYDDYLTGNVHYYEVMNEFGDVEDSCYGFIGDAKIALAEVPERFKGSEVVYI
jgi:hypothetical protein